MVCWVYLLLIVFLVFGEDRWQVPMGQLRNFIFIIGTSDMGHGFDWFFLIGSANFDFDSDPRLQRFGDWAFQHHLALISAR